MHIAVSNPKSPLKILALVTDAFGSQGGIAKFNRDLLGAICCKTGLEKVVAVPRLIPEPPGALPEKLEYISTGVGGKLRFTLASVYSAIRNRHSAILLCGHINLLPAAFLARIFLRRLPSGTRPPIVLVMHGVDAWQPTGSWLVNWLVRKIDAFISVSEFTRQRFLKWAQPDVLGPGDPPVQSSTPPRTMPATTGLRSFILPNCVDLTQFTPGPKDPTLQDRYGLHGKTVLLTVARLSALERYKGIDEVMGVLPALITEIPNVCYLIAGDGTDRVRLEQKATQLGIRSRVVFAGYISEAEKVGHYRLADLFVMPGWGEGFGIVYLESLACGVPVLASKVDASCEAVRHGELGVVVNPRDPGEVKQGIFDALRRAHGVVLPGLEYFSAENYTVRVHLILEALAQPHPVRATSSVRGLLSLL